ncbi:MAG: CHRD domain-containing protein [Candidatus Hydrogenedentes bacterium]|nr:CHRD domain-containing protein [Candidatus Hydrogenedentota bacterium]
MKNMKFPFYRSSPALMVVAAMTILTVAGCGGADDAGSSGGILLPGDKYGNTAPTAHQIYPDNGRIEGAINYAADLARPFGDIDMFRFEASAGVTYALQFQGFPVDFPDASIPEFLDITVLGFDADPLNAVVTSNLVSLPLTLGDLGEFRIMFTGQSNGTHYIRVAHARPAVGTGNYSFNLVSSQIGDGSTPLVRNSNIFTVFNTDGELVLPTQSVTGEMEIITFNPDTLTMHLRFDTEPVRFIDPTTLERDEIPQSPELHFHVGTPDNFDISDKRGTPGVPPHPTVEIISGVGPGSGIELLNFPVSASLFHLMIGHNWYMDVHFSTNLELVPRPVLSSRANGTLTFFQSELPMSGANVVVVPPDLPVDTINGLTLLYNSAYQRFMIDYEETGGASPNAPFPAPSLVGGTMHVHLGGPGQNGPVLIELGVLPPPLPLPQYEDVPWIKNLVRVLTDTEVWRLRNATYSGGWYVDLHTDAFPNGELRAEGFLEIQTAGAPTGGRN